MCDYRDFLSLSVTPAGLHAALEFCLFSLTLIGLMVIPFAVAGVLS